MFLRRKARLLNLLLVFVLLVLLYGAYLRYQGRVASPIDKLHSDNRHLPKAQTHQTSSTPCTLSNLPPLTDEKDLAKTQPFEGGEMDFLRKVRISKTNGAIPQKETLESWKFKHLSFLFHSYLENIQLICLLGMKMGHVATYGNNICDEEKFRPQKPCLAYTFRVKSKDALFEDDVARLYGCEVFLFSPGASDNLPHLPLVTVSNKSLNNSSLTTIKGSMKHQSTPLDVMKMDLDGGEWDALSKMAAAGELSQIRQLVVSLTVPAAKAKQKETIVGNLLVLKALQDAGFRTFRSSMRDTAEKVEGVYLVVRTGTYDLSLVNTNPPARSLPVQVFPLPPVSPGEQDMIFLRQLKTPIWKLPTWEEIQTLSSREMYYLYNRFLDNPTIHCGLMVKLGGQMHMVDGGYWLCDDPPYRPTSPCLVYSFGINNDFTFDDDGARLYGCDVFSFDPSMGNSYRRNSKVTFYKLGLGGHRGQVNESKLYLPQDRHAPSDWRIESFSCIKQLLGHENRTVDVLKMDPEGYEWPALEDMARAGELARVRQLLVEFHLWQGQNQHSLRRYLNLLAVLARAGFRVFYSNVWAFYPEIPRMDSNAYPVTRTIDYEVHFVNIRFQPPS